ncbi:ABC transporter permease [Anaeromyxobacter terrae]|uniref:ABC transporter permease n=1 Tax=Anaeromyxobacter terrae TaxID=2925406 RepID=UPI001F5976C5|nr:ABC transporter permease [Anaeromyxobacter sp. SG22]
MTAAVKGIAALLRFRELMFLLVARDLKVRYKRSILGMLWTLLNPLLQMLVYTLVFSRIMRIGVPQFPVFLLAGLLPWTLISVSATSSALSLLNNQGLIRKIAVPQAVYPLSIVGSKLVDLAVSLVPLAVIAAALGRPPGSAWLLLVPAVVVATCFAAGLSLLFSSLTVFFRDVRHLIDILFQIWFYVTPIIYPHEFLEKLGSPLLRSVLSLNPATPIIRWFQMVVYEGRPPDLRTAALATISAAATLVLGFAVFQRLEDEHIHYF